MHFITNNHIVKARALYPYVGDEATDLNLVAGGIHSSLFSFFVLAFEVTNEEIITILQEDDGSGWTKGILISLYSFLFSKRICNQGQNVQGKIGIFPTSYIEHI